MMRRLKDAIGLAAMLALMCSLSAYSSPPQKKTEKPTVESVAKVDLVVTTYAVEIAAPVQLAPVVNELPTVVIPSIQHYPSLKGVELKLSERPERSNTTWLIPRSRDKPF